MGQEKYETGVESKVSDDAFELDETLTQYQTTGEQDRWQQELEAARKERKDFDKRAVGTIERYADKRGGSEKDNTSVSKYNLLFANVDTKASALYARTPSPEIKRRWDDADDAVSRVAAMLLQRNLSYELETGNFDSVFKNIVWDRLVPGIGIGWVRLEQDEGEPEQLLTIDPITQEQIITNVPDSEIRDQLAEIDYVSWGDFLSAPCQVWTDCRWVSRRIPMSKEAIKARFSNTVHADVLKDLAFSKHESGTDSADNTSRLKPKNSIQSTVDVHEIWDKETRLIFWVVEGAEIPLDVKQDTNSFNGFFPTPLPPLGRFTTSSTIAISDYSLVQDLYRDLDNLQSRIAMLIQALKLRWVYDAGNPALKELYTTTNELEGVGVKDWAVQVSEKGGLKGSIEFAPLEEIAVTYQKCLAAQATLKQQIWEIEAIPDFIRGETQAYDSAAATNQKSAFGTSRLGNYQRDVAEYAEKLVRLKAHLICKFYKPEIIVDRAGTIPQADQQYLSQAVQLLKQEMMRGFRLKVSVDSIQLPNWNMERAERTQVVQAVGAALGQLMQVAQGNPAIGQLGMHLLKFAVAGYKGSDEIEGYIEQGLAQMIQAQAQQAGQPPQPTPAQLEQQNHQARIQGDIQVAQIDASSKTQIAQLQAQMAREKIASDNERAQMKAQLDKMDLMIKAFGVDTNAHTAAAAAHVNAHSAAHQQAMDLNPMGGAL